MAGPWERYQTAPTPAVPAAGPWQRYQTPAAAPPGAQLRASLPTNAVEWFTQTRGRAPTEEEITAGLPDTLRWQEDRPGVEAWDQAAGVSTTADMQLGDTPFTYDTFGNRVLTGLNSFGFNWVDEGIGAIYGPEAREAMNRNIENFAATNPGDAQRSSLLGGLASGVAMMGVPILNAGRAAGLGGQIARSATGGAVGGALAGAGAADGSLRERLIPAIEGGLLGGTIGAAVPPIARGFGISAPVVTTRTRGSTSEELAEQARQEFRAAGANNGQVPRPVTPLDARTARALGVEAPSFTPPMTGGAGLQVVGDQFDSIGTRIQAAYQRSLEGLTESGNRPVSVRAKEWLIDNTSGSPDRSIGTLERTRQELNAFRQEAFISGNRGDLAVIDGMMDEYDTWLHSLKPEDIVGGGDIQAAVQALDRARQLWRDMSRTTEIERIVTLAQLQAGNYTNAGLETALRQQFRALARNERRMASFSAEEQAAINEIVGTNGIDRIARFFGRFAPRGFFSGGLGLYGITAGDPMVMLLTGTGAAASRFARNRVVGRVEDFAEKISGGGRQLIPPSPGQFPNGYISPFGVIDPETPFLPAAGGVGGNRLGALIGGGTGTGREGAGRPPLVAPILQRLGLPGGVPRLTR